jgi:hypothetical protein
MQRLLFSALFASALFSTSCGTAQKASTESKPATEERQRPANRGDRAANQAARMEAVIEELELSEAAAKTYREINARYGKELSDLRRKSGGSRQEMMAEGGKLRAAQEREIFDMLNEAQREKYNAIIERRKTQMRNRQRVGRPGGRG